MSKLDTAKHGGLAMVSEIDQGEMAIRILEAVTGLGRPHPDPHLCLARLDREERERWHAAARAALMYLSERIKAGKAPA